MAIKYVDELELEEKRVFIRADLNVPLDDQGQITDDTRIRAVLPTIKYVLNKGGLVVLASHLGRPRGQRVEKYSMMPVAERLNQLLDREVIMAPDVASDGVKVVAGQLKPGQVLLLENLRFHPGETKNDEAFARSLADMCDVYVNDAFGASHRAHASIDRITHFVSEKAAGFLLRKEMNYFSRVLDKPISPFIAVLGGAKVSDKIGVIENLLKRVDSVLIGGGMAYTFLTAQGFDCGESLVERERIEDATRIIRLARIEGTGLLLPVDHVVAREVSAQADSRLADNDDIGPGWRGLDIGPRTIENFCAVIARARTIVWNGPMGVFEIEQFSRGTMAVAKAVADADATSVIGGGDSVAAVKIAGVADKISHISTGGGASLELLEGKRLPGIVALES
ncbi:MAG: phosphoglycerate kinase [Candidatus Alcyoniella australis]|nr:phosphoglycerate kinase [Candidatus Alcyoniella australis]